METQKKIKFRNVIVSGLTAGILILVIGAGLVPILGTQMNEILESRGVPPMGTGSIIYFTLVSLLNGISVIWIYALIENRFKSKCKAVVTVTLPFWFFTYFLHSSSLAAYGFMPVSFVAIGAVWGLLELFIGILAGIKVYNRVNEN